MITYQLDSRGQVKDLRQGNIVWEKSDHVPEVFGAKGRSYETLYQAIEHMKAGEIWWAVYPSRNEAQQVRDAVYRGFDIKQARAFQRRTDDGAMAVCITAVANKPERRSKEKLVKK